MTTFLTVSEAASLAKCSVATINRAIASGDIDPRYVRTLMSEKRISSAYFDDTSIAGKPQVVILSDKQLERLAVQIGDEMAARLARGFSAVADRGVA
jgi:hypothetical protein